MERLKFLIAPAWPIMATIE